MPCQYVSFQYTNVASIDPNVKRQPSNISPQRSNQQGVCIPCVNIKPKTVYRYGL